MKKLRKLINHIRYDLWLLSFKLTRRIDLIVSNIKRVFYSQESHYGFCVKVKLREPYPYLETTLRNVTEIHYNYRGGLGLNTEYGKQVVIAFESSYHGTGVTYDMEYVVEFESRPEDLIAKNF